MLLENIDAAALMNIVIEMVLDKNDLGGCWIGEA